MRRIAPPRSTVRGKPVRRNLASRRSRGGYTLAVFVLLVFGIMGLAAIVIDVGLARLAQRQMQSAADTAALEGLRGRDRDDLADPDFSRRESASRMAALLFDDDLDPAAGDARHFGAGPVVQLSGGVGDVSLNAAQTLSVPTTPVYKPQRADSQPGLELNLDNQPHGDLVAGSYQHAANHGDESAAYTRSDFDSAAAAPDAFLARLRRTNDFEGLDQQSGVSSRGPAWPLLFGRGSLVAPVDPASGYSPRHQGISVRATAVAQTARVKSVGQAHAALDLPGALPVVFYRTGWEQTLSPGATTVQVGANGDLLVDGEVVGYVSGSQGIGLPAALGDELPRQSVDDPATFVSQMLARLPSVALGYAALVPDPGGTQIPHRVIGFGCVGQLSVAAGQATHFVLARRTGQVAAENASATLAAPLDLLFRDELSDPHFAQLWQQHGAFQFTLLAPVLVR